MIIILPIQCYLNVSFSTLAYFVSIIMAWIPKVRAYSTYYMVCRLENLLAWEVQPIKISIYCHYN